MRAKFHLLVLAVLLPVISSGCKSMSVEKAQSRSASLKPQMTIDEVYKLLKAPQATLAGDYWWEYFWPGDGSGRLLRIKFQEQGGRWVVREWQWQ